MFVSTYTPRNKSEFNFAMAIGDQFGNLIWTMREVSSRIRKCTKWLDGKGKVNFQKQANRVFLISNGPISRCCCWTAAIGTLFCLLNSPICGRRMDWMPVTHSEATRPAAKMELSCIFPLTLVGRFHSRCPTKSNLANANTDWIWYFILTVNQKSNL